MTTLSEPRYTARVQALAVIPEVAVRIAKVRAAAVRATDVQRHTTVDFDRPITYIHLEFELHVPVIMARLNEKLMSVQSLSLPEKSGGLNGCRRNTGMELTGRSFKVQSFRESRERP